MLLPTLTLSSYFFFQAEDGIRDGRVTGVQTCALPIWIRGHARAICDRVFTGPRGECDFAKDVAADLPLLALADVLGVPGEDRWLLFDWSNRVIGYQDPDYASSAE